MAKAYLEFEEWSSAGGTPKRITFQFNPASFEVKQSANWRQPESDEETSEYVGPDPQEMSVEMLLDASETQNGDVTADVDALLASCHPTSASESRNEPLPPRVRFGWDRVHFEGYVVGVSADYQLFHPDGRPIRAKCTVTMKEIDRPPARQNPTSGTPAIHRTIDVVAGDTLPAIAYKEYGEPGRWRALATLNGIDDPLRLRPGTRLLVPPPRQAMELAG